MSYLWSPAQAQRNPSRHDDVDREDGTECTVSANAPIFGVQEDALIGGAFFCHVIDIVAVISPVAQKSGEPSQ